MDYTEKYLKYKQKYMALKQYANQQRGGANTNTYTYPSTSYFGPVDPPAPPAPQPPAPPAPALPLAGQAQPAPFAGAFAALAAASAPPPPPAPSFPPPVDNRAAGDNMMKFYLAAHQNQGNIQRATPQDKQIPEHYGGGYQRGGMNAPPIGGVPGATALAAIQAAMAWQPPPPPPPPVPELPPIDNMAAQRAYYNRMLGSEVQDNTVPETRGRVSNYEQSRQPRDYTTKFSEYQGVQRGGNEPRDLNVPGNPPRNQNIPFPNQNPPPPNIDPEVLNQFEEARLNGLWQPVAHDPERERQLAEQREREAWRGARANLDNAMAAAAQNRNLRQNGGAQRTPPPPRQNATPGTPDPNFVPGNESPQNGEQHNLALQNIMNAINAQPTPTQQYVPPTSPLPMAR